MKKHTNNKQKEQPEDVVVIDDNDGDDDVALKKTPVKTTSTKKNLLSKSPSISPTKNDEEPQFSYDDIPEAAVSECYDRLLEDKEFVRKMMS